MITCDDLMRAFQSKARGFIPFDAELLLFCEALSQALFKQSNHRENPDFVALGFWLRKSHLIQMQRLFLQKAGTLVPRGLVFHIPPGNIEVMLVYSWVTSLLLGNSNIVRIPGFKTARRDKLLSIIFNVLEEERFSAIKAMNFFIAYGHDDAVTSQICSEIDARVIWGGNETISKIREISLQPHAIDLPFPDRFSFSAVNAEVYLRGNQEQIAAQFFNDAYWFEQSACSSPRLIFWVGEKPMIEKASAIFYNGLQTDIIQRRYRISLGGVLLKKNTLFSQSLVLPVEKVAQYSNELSVLYLTHADERCRYHCGQGLFYHVPICDLNQIAAFTTHRDQTLTHCGFLDHELRNLAAVLNGKGITRMVPMGQALDFGPVWDGHDLFTALTQCDEIKI